MRSTRTGKKMKSRHQRTECIAFLGMAVFVTMNFMILSNVTSKDLHSMEIYSSVNDVMNDIWRYNDTRVKNKGNFPSTKSKHPFNVVNLQSISSQPRKHEIDQQTTIKPTIPTTTLHSNECFNLPMVQLLLL